MNYRQFIHYTSKTYTYLIWSENEAIIIDPVKEDVEKYITLIKELKLNLKYALDTHVHADHLTALGELREITQCKTIFGKESNSLCSDILISDADKISFGKTDIQCIYTPGHTEESYSFYMISAQTSFVFTGDTLLIRGCGRTDFQNGDPAQLYNSLHEKLLSLPLDTIVMPGHDYNGRLQSSIFEELNYNPRLQLDKEDFISFMNNLNLPDPTLMDIVVPMNKSCGNNPINIKEK